jgi:hypothetical protein
MNARFAGVMVVMLSLAAVTQARPSEAVRYPQGNVEILVNGAAVRRYAHDGRWYVEAVKGREYAIRLHNPYPVRVAVALSVDGLNTIDARETTAGHASKWVIEPYQSITISGWQTSASEARRFEFTTEEKSYGKALGRTSNLGIISAAFFRERPAPAILDRRREDTSRQQAPSPQAGAPAQEAGADAPSSAKAETEYAATGMGRRTGHAVTRVQMDLESAPAQAVDIRYEFRPQLVRLGILPADPTSDPLDRRERARGFDQGFSPVPPGLR